jgi:hypothetical protein
VLSIESSNSIETFVEVTEGMEIDRGYISPQFVTNSERLLVEYDNCRVLVTDQKIESVRDIVPILEQVRRGFFNCCYVAHYVAYLAVQSGICACADPGAGAAGLCFQLPLCGVISLFCVIMVCSLVLVHAPILVQVLRGFVFNCLYVASSLFCVIMVCSLTLVHAPILEQVRQGFLSICSYVAQSVRRDDGVQSGACACTTHPETGAVAVSTDWCVCVVHNSSVRCRYIHQTARQQLGVRTS